MGLVRVQIAVLYTLCSAKIYPICAQNYSVVRRSSASLVFHKELVKLFPAKERAMRCLFCIINPVHPKFVPFCSQLCEVLAELVEPP